MFDDARGGGERRNGRDRWYWAGVVVLLLTLLGSGPAAAGWPPDAGLSANNGVTAWPGVDGAAVCAWSVDLTGPVTAGPAVDGSGRIYIAVGDSVHSLGAGGSQLWSAQVGTVSPGCLALGNGSAGQQAVLYLGTSSPRQMLCLSASTGAEIWRQTLSFVPAGPPLVTPGRIYVGSEDGKVRALSADGTQLWSRLIGRPIRYGISGGSGGELYAADINGRFVAINAEDGSLLWRHETGTGIQSPPVLGPDGSIYFGDKSGFARRIDTRGHTLWRWALGYSVGPPSVLADGSSVYSRSDGQACRVSQEGVVQWVGGMTGAGPQLQPVVDSLGVIHVASGGKVTGLNASGGSVAWVLDAEVQTITALAIPSAGRLLVATDRPSVALYLNPDQIVGDAWCPAFTAVECDGLNGWHRSSPVIALANGSLALRPPGTAVTWCATAGSEEDSGVLGPEQTEFTVTLQGNVSVSFVDAGCQTLATPPLEIRIDYTPPEVAIANLPADGSIAAAGVFKPQIDTSDGHSGVASVLAFMDGSEIGQSCSLGPGDHCLRVIVADRAGNVTTVERWFRASACSAIPLNPVVVGGLNAARIPAWSRWITVLVRVPSGQGTTISSPQLGGVDGSVAARLPVRAAAGYRVFLVRFPREPVAIALAARQEVPANSITRVTLGLQFQCGEETLATAVSMLYRP